MAQQPTHNQQLKNPKYRNWVKAGLGLKYLKEGLETFSDDVVKQQHMNIIYAVQHKHNLPTVNCGVCSLRTLQPDHVRNKNKQCPFGQINCNCEYPSGKVTCPNNVCGAMYDEITKSHASNPPAPNWKNTDVQQWCTDTWAVAKCYINAPGYATKTNAKEIDCTGLLHMYINSKYLQTKIQCKITGQDVFTKTRSARNTIFHCNSMEMEDVEVNDHIDNMIAVLEDGKELINRKESQDAVIKLKELKSSSIVISAQDEAVVINEAFIEIDQRINDLKEAIQKGDENANKKEKETLQQFQTTTEKLENKAKQILDDIRNTGSDTNQNVEMELKKALDQIAKHKIEACIEMEQTKKAAVDTIKATNDSLTVSAESTISKYKEEACTELDQTKSTAVEIIKSTNESLKISTKRTLTKYKVEACTEMEQTKNAAVEIIKSANESLKVSAERTISKRKEEACSEMEQMKNTAVEIVKSTNESLKVSTERTISKHKEEACTEMEQAKNTVIENIKASNETAERNILKQKEEVCTEIEQTRNDTIEIINAMNESLKTLAERNILEQKEEACTIIEKQKNEAVRDITASVKRLSLKVDSPDSNISKRTEKVEEQLVNTNEEINEMKHERSTQQEDSAYIQAKKAFQNDLIEMYLENVVKVSPVLLDPERTDTVISQMYVDPFLEIEPRENDNTQERKKVSTYIEIYEKEGKPLKLIYLIGEAGSGKSTFCIDMIHKWCLAHSSQCTQESENVQFMKKFQFLFYILLRHNLDADHVETMIRNHYEDPILDSIFDKEADSCLILLDGLDEWTASAQQGIVAQFQTKGLPRRNLRKAYTVITTSRPWKFETLCIKSTEIHQTLRLRGVNDINEMAGKNIDELNKMCKTNKNKADFDKDISKCSFEDDMKRMPMVLQHLVCLWFEGKLKHFGKCEIYSNMVSLHFQWADNRNPDDHVLKSMKEKSILSSDVILPNQCICTELCEEHKYVIYHIGRLAYETHFSKTKELSLSFNNSTFRRLGIPEDVIECCLITGILSKEREVGLSLSRRKQVSFSFVHKSLQEFFAAIFLYVEVKRISPQVFKMYDLDTLDDDIKCLQDFLGSCKTVNDIIVQSNIIIFFCGFDPFLAAHVSKFLYNIAQEDDDFIDFRRNIKYEPFETRDNLFQTFMKRSYYHLRAYRADVLGMQSLLFSCIKEAIILEGKPAPLYFLADIVHTRFPTHNFEMMKHVNAQYVTSLSINLYADETLKTLHDIINDPNFGLRFSSLKIKLSRPPANFEEVQLLLLKPFVSGKASLKSVFLESRSDFRYSFWMRFFYMIPNLKSLLSLKLEHITLSYREMMYLCSCLTKATHLRQISLRHVTDNPDPNDIYPANPEINLSKHFQLQFLDHDYHTIDLVHFNTVNLETCAMSLSYNSNIRTAFQMLKASQHLKHLHILGNKFGFDKSVKRITNHFRSLLPFLKHLATLELQEFEFSDTIIASPLEMKGLKTVKLTNVTMHTDVFERFIESILAIPQNVNVEVRYREDIWNCLWNAAYKFASLLHNCKTKEGHNSLLMFNSKQDADI